MKEGNDTKMNWFAEDNGSRCSLESMEDGAEVRRHESYCDAAHRGEVRGDPCDSAKSRSGPLGVFLRVAGIVREDCIVKSVARLDTTKHYRPVGRKIQSGRTVPVDKDAVCNLHVGEPNESGEEDAHRNHHRSQNRVIRNLGVPHG